MNSPSLAIKVDVDTDRGTRIGVPNLLALFDEFSVKATFLFSLGPDNTGRAIKRIFRPGFLSKVSRTSVVSTYGIRTLMNGVLLPGPHVGRRNAGIMREARDRGHEVGIHCYDHIRWQDGLARMSRAEVAEEFGKARAEFERIFGEPARTAGSPAGPSCGCGAALGHHQMVAGPSIIGMNQDWRRLGRELHCSTCNCSGAVRRKN